MSAADDYPADGVIGGTAEMRDGLYEKAMAEIDRLREENVLLRSRLGAPLVAAGNRLFKQDPTSDDNGLTELTPAEYAREVHQPDPVTPTMMVSLCRLCNGTCRKVGGEWEHWESDQPYETMTVGGY